MIKCDIGSYFPNEIFFPLLVPMLVIGVVVSYYLCIIIDLFIY